MTVLCTACSGRGGQCVDCLDTGHRDALALAQQALWADAPAAVRTAVLRSNAECYAGYPEIRVRTSGPCSIRVRGQFDSLQAQTFTAAGFEWVKSRKEWVWEIQFRATPLQQEVRMRLRREVMEANEHARR